MTDLEEAIQMALEADYKVILTLTKSFVVYSLTLEDGCAYGRGVKLDDGSASNAIGCLPVIADSIKKSLKAIPEHEKEKTKHIRPGPNEYFSV